MANTRFNRRILCLCIATALSGCMAPNAGVAPGGAGTNAAATAARSLQRTGSPAIQHIVIIVQEARSFDNLFCAYPGSDSVKCSARARAIPLQARCTISDTFEDFKRDLKTGDFSHERAVCPGYTRPEYRTVPTAQTKIYRAIAQSYVLGDEMFSSTGNPTFESHQYHIAAQAGNALDQPFGKTPPDGCVYLAKVRQFGGPPQPACETYKTLATELEEVGLTWAYYAAGASEPTWDAFGWVKGASAGIAPPTQFFTDVANGRLGTVTWVTPQFRDSDLSGAHSATGPAWVASLVNAVGESQYWDSTAIFITWSGFGGWADHVRPPFVDRVGLGFRVPLLVVSPYAKQGYVSHAQFETASILRFVEDEFGLPQLASSDERARSPVDCFDFSQQPRAFVPIQTR
ncbi:MAG: alkaline phosphatase family protein [Candidatus Cybelea sp.]